MATYLDWLRSQGVDLYSSNGLFWRPYRGAWIPVGAGPVYGAPDSNDLSRMLSKSGIYLVRSTVKPLDCESPWWHVVADAQSVLKIKGKIKGMIQRGKRSCTFDRLEPKFLEKNGYKCYFSAYSRYSGAHPLGYNDYLSGLRGKMAGPFEFFGVFCGSALAGYAECLVDPPWVATVTIKFDPAFLKNYSSYVMIDGLIYEYVLKRGLRLCNGTVSVSHDTQFQDFLIKNGFRKEFGILHLDYHPLVRVAVKGVYPLRSALGVMRSWPRFGALESLLRLEELRRACARLEVERGG